MNLLDESAWVGFEVFMDVKTAGRTVDLFELFAKTKAPLTLSEIARGLSAPQSSCFNLVRALEARGFLYSIGGNKRLYPTRKLFDIANAIAGYEPVIPRVEPMLEKMRDATGETVILGTRQGDRVIYLAVAEGQQTIRYMSRAGELKPIHASAIGKALLSTMSPDERAALIKRVAKPAITGNTITETSDLLDEITAAADRGWSQTKGENVADVMAVAVPFDVEGVAYAVAVAGPIGRMLTTGEAHVATAQAMLAKLR